MSTKIITHNDRDFHIAICERPDGLPALSVEYLTDDESADAAGMGFYPTEEIGEFVRETLGESALIGGCFYYGEGKDGRQEEMWYIGADLDIVDADGEMVPLTEGDCIEPARAVPGDYDRGRILAVAPGVVRVAWEGSGGAMTHTVKSLAGMHVHTGDWRHEWPECDEDDWPECDED